VHCADQCIELDVAGIELVSQNHVAGGEAFESLMGDQCGLVRVNRI